MTFAARGDDYWFYYDDWQFSNPAILYPPLVMNYISMAILLVLLVRSFMFWIRGFRAQVQPETQAKEVAYEESAYQYKVQEPQTPRYEAVAPPRSHYSQDRSLDIKSISSPRPLSTVASEAYWSDISGGATLTRAPSVRSSDTKRPPSYASPAPSRAPTTLLRKPVN